MTYKEVLDTSKERSIAEDMNSLVSIDGSTDEGKCVTTSFKGKESVECSFGALNVKKQTRYFSENSWWMNPEEKRATFTDLNKKRAKAKA